MFSDVKRFKSFTDISNNMRKTNTKMECPECGSERIERKLGEVCCRKCGLIIEEGMAM